MSRQTLVRRKAGCSQEHAKQFQNSCQQCWTRRWSERAPTAGHHVDRPLYVDSRTRSCNTKHCRVNAGCDTLLPVEKPIWWDLGSNNWSRPDAGEGQHGGLPQGTWSTQNLTTAPLYSSLWCALSCRHDTQGLLHSSKIWLKASSTCHQCVPQDIDFGAFALPFGGRL